MSKIIESLNKLFTEHRIVFWYDEKEELREQFEEINMDSIEKLIVDNNEFEVKYIIRTKEANQKFLLYFSQPKQANIDNWLLDIEIANHVFYTDKESLVLQDLELPYNYNNWISLHFDFFNSKERTDRFKELLHKEDDENILTKKLLQVIFQTSQHKIESLLKAYSVAFIANKEDDIKKKLSKYNLHDFFWSEVEIVYNYKSEKPSIYDFLLEVYQKSFVLTANKVRVNYNTEVLLSAWKDSSSFKSEFEKLSDRVSKDISIKDIVEQSNIEDIIEEDVFELVERHIIREISHQLQHSAIGYKKVISIIKIRESKYWYHKYKSFYDALIMAANIINFIDREPSIKIAEPQDAFEQYIRKWYKVDQYYRLFIQHYRETNQNSVLNALYTTVHKIYSNTWLLNLSDKWQSVLDKSNEWYFGRNSQFNFYTNKVQPYINKNNKIFVIISDALRYECGQSLHELLNEENRFISDLKYQITGLPSYTQLGMAALLPHKQLSFGKGDSILVDEMSTLGSAPRQKVLIKNTKKRAITISAEAIMKLNSKSEQARNLTKNNDIVYIYNNRIDKTGHEQEERVIEAAKEEISYLVDLVRKLTNMNANNIIITADHGFIYQNEKLEESDFTDGEISGDIINFDRRFVIGNGLSYNNNIDYYQSKSLNIESSRDILIPKGIGRLRQKGSGSRYAHGGSSLQEIIVPMLFVTKKRKDTVRKVDIDILNKSNNRITTNIHNISFFQTEAIKDGVNERTIKSYFAIEQNDDAKEIISDVFLYTFDIDSNTADMREVKNKFTILTSKKRSHNVFLFIDEKLDNSNTWHTITKYPYSLNLAMENDFDDF